MAHANTVTVHELLKKSKNAQIFPWKIICKQFSINIAVNTLPGTGVMHMGIVSSVDSTFEINKLFSGYLNVTFVTCECFLMAYPSLFLYCLP